MLWSEYKKCYSEEGKILNFKNFLNEIEKKDSFFKSRIEDLSKDAKKLIRNEKYDKRVQKLADYLNGIYYPSGSKEGIAKKIDD